MEEVVGIVVQHCPPQAFPPGSLKQKLLRMIQSQELEEKVQFSSQRKKMSKHTPAIAAPVK